MWINLRNHHADVLNRSALNRSKETFIVSKLFPSVYLLYLHFIKLLCVPSRVSFLYKSFLLPGFLAREIYYCDSTVYGVFFPSSFLYFFSKRQKWHVWIYRCGGQKDLVLAECRHLVVTCVSIKMTNGSTYMRLRLILFPLEKKLFYCSYCFIVSCIMLGILLENTVDFSFVHAQ